MDLEDIFRAVKLRWDAQSLTAVIGSGVHDAQAGLGDACPYVVVDTESVAVHKRSSRAGENIGGQYNRVRLRFDMHCQGGMVANGPENAALRAAFDHAPLSVGAAGEVLFCFWVGEDWTKSPIDSNANTWTNYYELLTGEQTNLSPS